MKIAINQITVAEALSPEVSSAIRVMEHKRSKRQVYGFIDTVASQLTMHHKWKEVRHAVAQLSRTPVSSLALNIAVSLEKRTAEVGDWRSRNEVRHLKNIMVKALKEVAHA